MMKQFYGNLAIKIIDLSWFCLIQDAVVLGTMISCSFQQMESPILNNCCYVRLLILREQQNNLERHVDDKLKQMGLPSLNKRWYLTLNRDRNQIGNKGLKYLSRMESPNLKELNLCMNMMTKARIT